MSPAPLGAAGRTAFLVDLSDGEAPVWLSGALVSGETVAFRAEAGHRYLAASESGLLAAEVRFPQATALRRAANEADWVVIAPREFAGAAETLAAQRRSQGLLTRVVAVEEVFEAFGGGERRPEAIRDFLAFAFHEWRRGPRYALLLGDASYDPRDYLATGIPSHVPTPTARTSFLWTAADPLLAAVNGEDRLPDLALGRLPASSAEQAEALVAKLIAYEQSGYSPALGRAVVVADNPDLAGDFDADASAIAEALGASREVETIRLSALGRSGTRSAVLGAFDAGASLMSYLGHGGSVLWASENVFNVWDVAALAPQPEQPLLLTLNCLNGYFTMPDFDSLAEAAVKAEGRGAIAAFSPSAMSYNHAARLYHQALLAALGSGANRRLGDAVLAAQVAYANSGAFPELLAVYHLFADPGMPLR